MHAPSLIFCDETLGDGTYRDLLRDLSKAAKARVVVMSLAPDRDDTYNEAITLGAFDMIASPCRRSDVQWIAIRAMQDEVRRSATRRRQKLASEAFSSNSERSETDASDGTVSRGTVTSFRIISGASPFRPGVFRGNNRRTVLRLAA